MSWEERLAQLFALDDEGWARHANPWSGYSRMATGLPLIILAAWSRVWIGWWWLALMALVVLWLKDNPRLFPPARDDSDWMTRGVLGERLWVERKSNGIAPKRPGLMTALNAVSGIGALAMIYGLWKLDLWWTAGGGVVSFAAKTWFIHLTSLHYESAVQSRPELTYRPPV